MPRSRPSVDAQRVTKGLVSYLKKVNQVKLLPDVARATLRLTRAHTDPNLAKVATAVALSDEQIGELETQLSQTFKRPITVDNQVNPELIAGMTIRVGDQLIDQSFNTQINDLGKKLVV